MSKITDTIEYFKSLSEIRERLNPLQKQCDEMYKLFNESWMNFSYTEKNFISDKLFENLSDSHKESIEKSRIEMERMNHSSGIYSINMPFDPKVDEWRLYDIQFKEEGGDKFVNFFVSSKKDEGSISGLMTFYNKTFSTGWINVKEIQQL